MTLETTLAEITKLYFETQKQVGYLTEEVYSLSRKLSKLEEELTTFKTFYSPTPVSTQEFSDFVNNISTPSEELLNPVPSTPDTSKVAHISPRKKFYQGLADEGPKVA